jgi:hypothetical protein
VTVGVSAILRTVHTPRSIWLCVRWNTDNIRSDNGIRLGIGTFQHDLPLYDRRMDGSRKWDSSMDEDRPAPWQTRQSKYYTDDMPNREHLIQYDHHDYQSYCCNPSDNGFLSIVLLGGPRLLLKRHLPLITNELTGHDNVLKLWLTKLLLVLDSSLLVRTCVVSKSVVVSSPTVSTRISLAEGLHRMHCTIIPDQLIQSG